MVIEEGSVGDGGEGGLQEGEAAVYPEEGLAVQGQERHTRPHCQDVAASQLHCRHVLRSVS